MRSLPSLDLGISVYKVELIVPSLEDSQFFFFFFPLRNKYDEEFVYYSENSNIQLQEAYRYSSPVIHLEQVRDRTRRHLVMQTMAVPGIAGFLTCFRKEDRK